MAGKNDVNLDTYKKKPRMLSRELLPALQTGCLSPIRAAVNDDDNLRLDIRDQRFNVYYGGGSLLRVGRRGSHWEPHFDTKYYKKKGDSTCLILPEWLERLPRALNGSNETLEWVAVFPKLKEVMEAWWLHHPKGERAHCQSMAKTNGERSGNPASDYLILDMEYQWAQRSLDLIAAKRNTTVQDPIGWERPVLVFIEVKSARKALVGEAGIAAHVKDFGEIVQPRELRKRQAIEEIKEEFIEVVNQKRTLGLLSKKLPLRQFADGPPEMLLVFVGPDIDDSCLAGPLSHVESGSRQTSTGRDLALHGT